MSTSPNDEHDGENCKIREGDDSEVEADWFVVGRRRWWWWWRLRKKATNFYEVFIVVSNVRPRIDLNLRSVQACLAKILEEIQKHIETAEQR